MTLIYACSSNPGKLAEFALVAGEPESADFQLLPLPGLKEIQPPEETGTSFEENAAEKARYYSQFTHQLVLADDSGIEVDALGGAPGIYSARYAGIGATGEANNLLLLDRMKGQSNRTARFVCAITLAQSGRVLHTVRGSVQGELLHAARGVNGFGYDPLFFYPAFNCTFAELEGVRKFSISHRGHALRQTIAWLTAGGNFKTP